MLSSHSREALKKVSAATLTTVLFKRGLRNVFIQGVFLLNRQSPRMVGEAFTLRNIPAREDLDHIGVYDRLTRTAPRGPMLKVLWTCLLISIRRERSATSRWLAGRVLVWTRRP